MLFIQNSPTSQENNIFLHLSFSNKLYGDQSLKIFSCNVTAICKPLESTDGRKQTLEILSTEPV